MKNHVDDEGVPLGFGMALAQNEQAMNWFARLPEEERQSVLAGARAVGSKQEMQEYVSSLAGRSE